MSLGADRADVIIRLTLQAKSPPAPALPWQIPWAELAALPCKTH